jgi:predicted MPP superfamily phosphohydrolase
MSSGRRRRVLRIFWTLASLGAIALADALFIEPNWIEVTHSQVSAPIERPLKIAHLSDLHSSGVDFRERRLLRLLEREKPDVIVISGDSLAPRGSYEQAGEVLSRLRAPLGVWLVRGNWENWHRLENEHQYYGKLGVSFLLNESAEVAPNVWLIGLDDPTFGHADLAAALKIVSRESFRIAVFHSPRFFESSAGSYDLALAGHSHGGQVRIPFLKPLWLPPGIGPYVEGWYEKDGSRMYVSRGIGMTLLPIRFFCRPELAIITLAPERK